MTYIRSTTWQPGVAGGTLIRAVNLNHIEDGIVAVSDDIEQLDTRVDDVNSGLADLSSEVAQIRDSINKGGVGGGTGTGTGGGNGTITQVNGYPGPIVILTKSDIGLDQVNNTSDANKPISTATQAALDSKASLNSPAFTGQVTGIDKSSVGLGNVNNTADADKPVSTAQAQALALKANLNSPTFTGTVSGISKAMVGLANADNTSDVVKFNNYGVLPTIYYTGSGWPTRTVPPGYTGAVAWNSELYSNVDNPAGAVENDRWARKLTATQ